MPGLRKLVIFPWPILPGSQEERKRGEAAARDLAPRRLPLWAQLGTNAGVREEGRGGPSDALPPDFRARVPWGKDWFQGFGSLV